MLINTIVPTTCYGITCLINCLQKQNAVIIQGKNVHAFNFCQIQPQTFLYQLFPYFPIYENYCTFCTLCIHCSNYLVKLRSYVHSIRIFNAPIMLDFTDLTHFFKNTNKYFLFYYIDCPEDFILGVLWERTLTKTTYQHKCSDIHPSFKFANVVTRYCMKNRTWAPVDISQCVMDSDSPLIMIVIVTLNTQNSSLVKSKEEMINQDVSL